MLSKLLGQAFFRANGWTYENNPALWSDKQVVVGFPHTSNKDAMLSMALFHILGIKAHTLIKKELFKGPMKPVLEALGAISVDRNSSHDVVAQMAAEFARHAQFTLVLAPEGTRAKNGQQKPVRTGFWHIAKAANVPIVLMLSDTKNKKGRFLGKIIPTDLHTDLLEIQRLYQQAGIYIPLPE